MHGEKGRRWTATDWLVVGGIICCFGMMAISALVSYRVGFRRAESELDGHIYGLGLGLADLLKAFAPFAMAWAWRTSAIGSFIAAAVLFAVVTTASLQAELEFASELQSSRSGGREAASVERDTTLTEIRELESQVAALGNQRSRAEIERAVDAVLARKVRGGTVDTVSKSCTETPLVVRESCAEIALLRQEWERARDWETRTEKLREARARLRGLGDAGTRETDPQLETVSGLLAWFTEVWRKDDVRLALLLLIPLVIEVGSGLGLFVVTTPWRLAGREGARPVVGDSERLGLVEEYADVRIAPMIGSRTTVVQIFSDYQAWCRAHRHVALSEPEFSRACEALLREVGAEVVVDDNVTTFLDTGLA